MFGLKTAKQVEALVGQVTELKTQLTTQAEQFEIKISEERGMIEKASKNALENAFRNITTQIFPNYTTATQSQAYQTLDDLYSVVSRIATAAAMIPMYAETKDGEELPETDKLNVFLSTFSLEQRISFYTYLLLHGEVIAVKDKLDFGINAGLQKLITIHPASVTTFITKSFPYEVVGYRYYDNLSGEMIDYLKEEVFHVKMFNPDVDINMQARGLPPIKVLTQRLTRVKAGLDVSVAQMQNGGLPGIVYDKTPGVTPEAVSSRRDNFGRFLQNRDSKGAPYFSANDLGYIAIGSSLADLSLAELATLDLDKICNAYHVPSSEFNNKNASTESNVETHNKSFFTNGVLPIVCLVIDGMNRQVVPDIKTKGIVKEDITDIPELQPNMKEVADGLRAMIGITLNEAREKAGWDKVDDPIMDEPLIPSGYQLAKELDMQIPDVNNTAGDYNNTGANVVPIKRAANG